MVKYIIDLCTEKIPPAISKLQGSFLILNETCHLPEGHSYIFFSFSNVQHSESLRESLKEGNFFFRTSSELERGVIFSKIIIEFPNARIMTERKGRLLELNSKLKSCPLNIEKSEPLEKVAKDRENAQQNLEIKEKVSESKLIISQRPYHDIPEEPRKVVPQSSAVKEVGPIIGGIRPLIETDKRKLPINFFPNPKDLNDRLDPIIRSKSNRDIQNFQPKVFENEPNLKNIFERVLKIEKIKQIEKFFQLFEIVSQVYLSNGKKDGDDLSDLKKVLRALFDTKIISLKNPELNIDSLFTKNCWNIELEFNKI